MKRIFLMALIALVMGGAVLSRAEVRSRHEPGITYYGLSTDTKPTDSLVGPGSVFTETDTGVTWLYNGSAWGLQGAGGGGVAPVAADLDTLKTTGVSTAIDMTGSASAAFYLSVSSIDTDITVYLEAKNNLSGWSNVNASGDSTVIDLDGTTVLQWSGFAPADSARVFWSGESGGTAAVVALTAERW